MTNIRKATRQDLPAALALIKELAIYENAEEEAILTLEQFEADGFGEQPLYNLYVAEIEQTKEIVGIALFFVAYSTWKGKMVYLDDLVVTEAYRRKGIGEQLLSAIFEFARKEKANQVRWHVLDWNEPAINFYKKLNVKLEAEWITCKFSKEQIN